MGVGIKQLVVVGVVSVAVAACGSSPDSNGSNGSNGGANNQAAAGHVHGAPPPPAAPLRPGERFLELGLQKPYQAAPPEGGTDEYRCFLVDPKLTEPTFLMGSQFLPQNAAIVHHAILYSIGQDMIERAKTVDAQTPADGWPCFGGVGLSEQDNLGGGDRAGGKFVGAWAPGAKETLIGDNTGYLLQPGTQIALQIHYNLLSTNGKPGPADQSSVRLRFAPGTAAVTPLKGMLLPGPIELPCTAEESGPLCDREAAIQDLVKRTGKQARLAVDGLNYLCNAGKPPAAGNTQHCDNKIRESAQLYAVAPHMHLLGRSITVELNPGTPGAQVLLEQKEYNFDDQSSQSLPQPVQLKAGDTIRVTCTHDAKLRSQLPELQVLKPRYVVWGDGTSDEMCLAILTMGVKA
jgi:hypothetical protein